MSLMKHPSSILLLMTLILETPHNLILAQQEEMTKPAKVILMKEPFLFDGNYTFTGAEACLPCHETQYAQWKRTAHARAFQSLLSLGKQDHLECIKCHVTGFGNPSGYWKDNPDRQRFENVQCEACHGARAEHAKTPSINPQSYIKDCPLCEYRKICILCHNHKNSPKFDFNKYLEKIIHKKTLDNKTGD